MRVINLNGMTFYRKEGRKVIIMEKVIGEIVKTNNVKTMVRLTEFKGRELIDIRDFFKPKGAIDFSPTKKGICIDVNKIADLITLLESAENEILKLKGVSNVTTTSTYAGKT